MATGVKFYESKIRQFTDVGPAQAHALAAAQAAGIGAKRINSGYTGTLARDVATPKTVGIMHSQVGSGLPYANIENKGGTITAKHAKRLLIRGRGGKSGAARTTTGGAIVASATSVQHKGKHYLEAVVAAYPKLMVAALKRFMPG